MIKIFFLVSILTAGVTSLFASVGITGPNGEVTLFTQGFWVARSECPAYTILVSEAEAFKQCKGSREVIRYGNYEKTLRNFPSSALADKLWPLTKVELDAYTMVAPGLKEIQSWEKELKIIEDFIDAYGEGSADLARKKILVDLIASHQKRKVLLLRVEDEIQRVLTDMSTGRLAVLNVNTHQNTFIYTFLKSLDPEGVIPCGQYGSIAYRMDDCAVTDSSREVDVKLTMRSKHTVNEKTNFIETYYDSKALSLWSGTIHETIDWNEAVSACKEYDTLNNSVIWKLPTVEELAEATTNGLMAEKDSVRFWRWHKPDSFSVRDSVTWTSSELSNSEVYAFALNRKSGFKTDKLGIHKYYVRCVGKLK